MVPTLLAIGIFGFLGLSILCPLLAFPAYCFQRRTSKHNTSKAPALPRALTINIIIPAHNEAAQIGNTLTSIQHSMRHLDTRGPTSQTLHIAIRVGADGCTDQTAAIARQFDQVSVTESSTTRSKWATVKSLLSESAADWVILVDSGALWPEDFVATFVNRINREPNALAAAPSYQVLRGGWMSRIIWQVETSLKRLESLLCGGPVSLHGATVAYKTAPLKKVLTHLGDTLWLNDDVVIPLVLRSLYPEGRILYPVGHVQDAGVRNPQFDLARRKRMLRGNLQWARTLLPDCFARNPVAGIVAMRRVFRMFWAYWLIFTAVGAIRPFQPAALPEAALAGMIVMFSGHFRQLAGAAWVSFLAPFQMIRPHRQLQGAWE